MKLLNTYFLLFLFPFLAINDAFAQVAKTIIVEHTTNTRCSVCSSRNPGFYQNLNSQSGIIHLSIHPSSPYSNCVLNQHNPAENDARTNYYGIYGSTPKLVIQGTNISPGADYSSPSIWDPFIGQTSPASIQIEQNKQSDLIQARVSIQTESTHNLEGLKLFIALAEDVVNYNAPNGENQHFDVFRKALPNEDGFEVTLPQNVGASVSFDVEIAPHPDWDLDQMFVVAILQNETDKEVIQAAATTPGQQDVISSIQTPPVLAGVQLSPNPFSSELSITLEDQEPSSVRVFDILGNLILADRFIERTQLNTTSLTTGTYIIEIVNSKGRYADKLIRD